MASFKIVAMAVGLVFTLGFINASAISDQLNWKYNPAMVDFQTLLLIAQSSMDSKMMPPPSCKCEGTKCNCCKVIKLFKWKKNACVEVEYKKEDSSFGLKFTFGDRHLFSGSKPETGGEPACFKHRSLLGIKVCVDVTNFNKSEAGDKIHGCVLVSGKLIDETVTYRMGCFDLALPQKEPPASTYYYSDPAADAENDEEAMADFQTLPLIVQSFVDSKMMLPPSCKCAGTKCNCCKTLKIIKWSKDACVGVEYKKEGSLFGIDVTFGTKVLFNGTKSATIGGETACFKTLYMPGVKLCVEVTNFTSEGDKTHGCVSITAKLGKTATFPMACFDLAPEQKEPSAVIYYYSDPGEEAEEIDSPTGWVEIEETAPLPDEDYLIMGADDE